MTTITLNPTSPTQSVYWDTASLWSPETVPDSADDAVVAPVIDSNGSPYSFFLGIKSGESYTIGSFDLASPNFLALYGSLSVLGDFNAAGEIDMYGGALSAGSLEISGYDLQGAGTVTVSGALTVVTNIIDAGLTVDAGSLNLQGQLLAIGGDETINVGAGGFNGLDDGVLTGGTYTASESPFGS